MISAEGRTRLLAARSDFIENASGELIDLIRLVEETIPNENDLERKDWIAHMGSLVDVWERRTEGENSPWPDPPESNEQIRAKTPAAPSLMEKLSGEPLCQAMCLERKAQLEGATGVGPARQAAAKTGRTRNALVDDLVLEFMEPKSSRDPTPTLVTYCVACDHRIVGRDSNRVFGHAGNKCEKLRENWETLYKRVQEKLSKKSNTMALEEGNTKDLPKVRKAATNLELKREGTVLEHFNTAKISVAQQAHLDLLLFKLHISQESAAFISKLASHLKQQTFLTLSFDGWSTRKNDEVYTFHTTTPARRSFFVEGHVFKATSVTGLALLDVVKGILKVHDPRQYAAVAGDNGPNVRLCKKELHTLYSWILRIYDPCHNLNLFLKDLGKESKDLLSIVSGISNYFGKLNYGTSALVIERKAMNITQGIKSASETRFSSSYLQAKAIQSCMPAIQSCYEKGTLAFDTAATKKLIPYISPKQSAHWTFMGQLSSFIQTLAPGANAILSLEGQAVTCADVFYAWVCIAWHLERLIRNTEYLLIQLRPKILEVYNHRYEQMMSESSHEVFLLAYYLHPLFRHNGGIKLVMPTLRGSEKLSKEHQPAVYKRFLVSALLILQGEQKRVGKGGAEESSLLVDQLAQWAYNHEPFRSHPWDIKTAPLDYWKGLCIYFQNPGPDSSSFFGTIATAGRKPCFFGKYPVKKPVLPLKIHMFPEETDDV